VENALQILNDKEDWFHHHKLMSDGLATFTGDKNALAEALWDKYKKWGNYLMLAVVQFITLFSPDFREPFFSVLCDPSADPEIRLAVVRYYRRYTHEPARRVLMEFLTEEQQDENLAILAVSALEKYPGSDTAEAIINALSSPVWHIRYNASSALVAMRTPEDELLKVLQSEDRYAREILTYRLEQEGDVYRNILMREREKKEMVGV
ncbi:MAG: HEAT repeat domain-containing protein, partial [Oscillospiraceae bacterium]|nr:HEAT repeat domain-containing protein [Oscillospiraceae bacterium]